MNVPQSIPACRRFTINDFNAKFTDDDACLDWLMEQRHPGGIATCSYCKVDRKHHRIATKKAFACGHCGTYISPMAGTIFAKSSTSLRLWFYAMYLMSATRCGISAKQIQRECGVTYKTAWRMFKQIRTLMGDDTPLKGKKIEMDETYVGGKDKNKQFGKWKSSYGRSTDTKTPVFGMVERGGEVRAYVTPDVKVKTLYPIIQEKVLDKATVFTDDYAIYEGLQWMPRASNTTASITRRRFTLWDRRTRIRLKGFGAC